MVFAYAAPFALWLAAGFPASVLSPLLTLPAGYLVTRSVRASDDPGKLAPMTARMSGLALVYAILLAIGVAQRA